MRRLLRELKHIPSPLPLIFIIVATIGVILYGRGYRVDIKKNTLKPTSLLSATSDPIGAQVFINNELKTATNNPITLDPNWYSVKIVKEGYIPWEKRLRLQGEVVTRTDAFLFPTSPSLSPLTNSGVLHPLISPDGTKISYTIPQSTTSTLPKKAGLWIYELVDRPFGLNRDPKQLAISEPAFDFSTSQITWSPDATQIMVDNGKSIRLYALSRPNDFQDISANAAFILKDWEEERRTKKLQTLAAFKQPVIDMATQSAQIIAFSPDETKILYEATSSATLPPVITPALIGTNPTEEKRALEPGKIYVYDSKEDKNFLVLDEKELPQVTEEKNPKPKTQNPKPFDLAQDRQIQNSKEIGNSGTEVPVHWFPTSRHLVLTLPGKIDIMEYDRTNWVTVYSGPFVEGFLAPWPNASRIVVLTNLNPGVSELPNLYTVNLR